MQDLEEENASFWNVNINSSQNVQSQPQNRPLKPIGNTFVYLKTMILGLGKLIKNETDWSHGLIK